MTPSPRHADTTPSSHRRRDHQGTSPSVDPTARVTPTAVLVGDVSIGAGAVVLDGAVVVAESAPVHIGPQSIIMENAVVRGAGSHPASIGRRTLVGPGAHVTGAVIGDHCLIATHASVFNGARIGDGVLVAIGAIVHVGTELPPGSRVPMLHIACGEPAQVYPPGEAETAHQIVEATGFTREVFGTDTAGMSFSDTMSWICGVYSRSLCREGGAP